MRIVIEVDERKATATDTDDLMYEIEHVVRKYSEFATIKIERFPK